MEVKNKKELKKAINENVSPIIITDRKLAKHVKIAFAIKEGRFWEYMGLRTSKLPVTGVVSEGTLIALGILAAATIFGVLALIKNKNIEIQMNPDGSVTLKTSD